MKDKRKGWGPNPSLSFKKKKSSIFWNDLDSHSAIVSMTAPHMVAMETIALVRICKGSNGVGGTPIPRTKEDSVFASEKSIGSTEKYVLLGWSCRQWIPLPVYKYSANQKSIQYKSRTGEKTRYL